MKNSRKRLKVMFSEVVGRVLCDGDPVSNQEVLQRFSWLGVDGGTATTRTDDDGVYHFPAVFSHERKPRGTQDIFISQTISTRYDDREITLWQTTKYDFLDGGELGGHPIRIVRELTEDSRNFMIPSFSEYRTNLDGVLELDHPYVRDLERGARGGGDPPGCTISPAYRDIERAGDACSAQHTICSPHAPAASDRFDH